jgi:hypothetical protein
MQPDMTPMAAQATQQARPFNGNMFDSTQMDPYYYQNTQVYPQQPVSLQRQVHVALKFMLTIVSPIFFSCNTTCIAPLFRT